MSGRRNNGSDNVMARYPSDGVLFVGLGSLAAPFGAAIPLLNPGGSAQWVGNSGTDSVSVFNRQGFRIQVLHTEAEAQSVRESCGVHK